MCYIKIMLKNLKNKKFEVAPRLDIESYHNIAEEFFPKILDMKYEDVLLTDESHLYDFTMEFGKTDKESERLTEIREDEVLDKIKAVYKLDVSDIDDLNLVEIFKRIENLV